MSADGSSALAEEHLGCGVWLVSEATRPIHFELRDVPGLIAAIGPHGESILHGFLVAFESSDRLAALASLLAVNEAHVEPPLRLRNGATLVWLTLATFHEALDALRLLAKGGVTRVVGAEYVPWRRLQEMKRRWESDSFLRDARNVFGAHLGAEEVLRGLRSLGSGERLRVFDHTAGNRRTDTIYPAASTLLLRTIRDKTGAPYTDERFRAAGEQATSDAFVYGIYAEFAFLQVLTRAGVRDLSKPEDEAEVLAAIDARESARATDASPGSATRTPRVSQALLETLGRIGWAPEKDEEDNQAG